MYMLHLTNYWSWQTYSEDWTFSALVPKTLQQPWFANQVVAVPTGGTARSLLWHPSVLDYVAELSVYPPLCRGDSWHKMRSNPYLMQIYALRLFQNTRSTVLTMQETICLSPFPDYSNGIDTIYHFLIDDLKKFCLCKYRMISIIFLLFIFHTGIGCISQIHRVFNRSAYKCYDNRRYKTSNIHLEVPEHDHISTAKINGLCLRVRCCRR